MNIYQQARAFQRMLLTRERSAASEMVRYYGRIWQGLNDQILNLCRQYYADPEANVDWLYKYDRLNGLRAQAEAQIRSFARHAETSIQAEQYFAVDAAQTHSEQLIRLGLGEAPAGASFSFNRMATGAVTDLIGFLQDGTPLRDLLDELPGNAGQAVADSLVTGLANGKNPREVARTIREALGNNLTRALRIARTEQLRAYREASLRSYRANSDVLNGWIWMSAANSRTCAVCWSMHGTKHSLDEQMNEHICGRCTMIPWTKSWADLGYSGIKETSARMEPGKIAFALLPREKQYLILGPAKYAALQAKAITLDDLVGVRVDEQWGSSIYEKSLKELGLSSAEWVRQYREQYAVQSDTINFTMRPTVMLGFSKDLQSFYPDGTPGKEFIVSRMTDFDRSSYHHTWNEHPNDARVTKFDDVPWLDNHTAEVMRAVRDPMFIEAIPRQERRKDWGVAHVIPIDDKRYAYLAVIVRYPVVAGRNNGVITTYRALKNFVLDGKGQMKSKWIQIKK